MGTSSERAFNGSGRGYLPAGTIGNRTHILSERLKAGTEFKRLKRGIDLRRYPQRGHTFCPISLSQDRPLATKGCRGPHRPRHPSAISTVPYRDIQQHSSEQLLSRRSKTSRPLFQVVLNFPPANPATAKMFSQMDRVKFVENDHDALGTSFFSSSL